MQQRALLITKCVLHGYYVFDIPPPHTHMASFSRIWSLCVFIIFHILSAPKCFCLVLYIRCVWGERVIGLKFVWSHRNHQRITKARVYADTYVLCEELLQATFPFMLYTLCNHLRTVVKINSVLHGAISIAYFLPSCIGWRDESAPGTRAVTSRALQRVRWPSANVLPSTLFCLETLPTFGPLGCYSFQDIVKHLHSSL